MRKMAMKKLSEIESFLLRNESVLGKDGRDGKLKALGLIDRACTIQGFLALGEIRELNAYEDISENLELALGLMKDYRADVWKELSVENLQAHKIYSELRDIYLSYLGKFESVKAFEETGSYYVKRKVPVRTWEPRVI